MFEDGSQFLIVLWIWIFWIVLEGGKICIKTNKRGCFTI